MYSPVGASCGRLYKSSTDHGESWCQSRFTDQQALPTPLLHYASYHQIQLCSIYLNSVVPFLRNEQLFKLMGRNLDWNAVAFEDLRA